jgi:hypothetical protein
VDRALRVRRWEDRRGRGRWCASTMRRRGCH